MTQVELSRAASVSVATIRAIERGARSPSDDTLDSISSALGVDPSRLTENGTRVSARIQAALPRISAVIAAYDIPMGNPSRLPEQLATSAGELVAWRLGAQYCRIAMQTPALLDDAIRTVHTSTGADLQAAARLLTATARAADAVAYKNGGYDLSARLIDLMRWAGTQAEDDPLLAAEVAYVRTETFFHARAYTAGLRALQAAIDAAPAPDRADTAAARGALHMRAAVISGRSGDAATAAAHLVEASKHAELAPEGIYGGTAFGPSSVRIHEVSVAVALGTEHVSQALAVARTWKPPRDLPGERRSGFYIDLARAQLWAGLADDAFESLKVARLTAPQHTREHPWVREDAATLRRLKRGPADELTAFAVWAGAL